MIPMFPGAGPPRNYEREYGRGIACSPCVAPPLDRILLSPSPQASPPPDDAGDRLASGPETPRRGRGKRASLQTSVYASIDETAYGCDASSRLIIPRSSDKILGV